MRNPAKSKGPSTNPPGRLKSIWDVALDSWRGYHFGKSMPPGELPPAEHCPGPLEQYFDDHKIGPGLWKWRHYFPIYERHLAKFRDREVHMVEIGVLKGGSLDMWTWYLGARSHLYGVDISEDCLAYQGPQKRVFIGDQSDPEFWKHFLSEVPSFDIVLDNGGHHSFQQRPTFEALMPHLNPGGVYICEDVHHAFNPFTDYLYEFYAEPSHLQARSRCRRERTFRLSEGHRFGSSLSVRGRRREAKRPARLADSPQARKRLVVHRANRT